jgi:hypothetical protein
MSRETEAILNRLPGIESRSRWIDRDGRRALAALGAVTAIVAALAAHSRESAEEAAARSIAPVGAATVDPVGAIQRIRLDPDAAEKATSPPQDGYESLDAIGPGRRS